MYALLPSDASCIDKHFEVVSSVLFIAFNLFLNMQLVQPVVMQQLLGLSSLVEDKDILHCMVLVQKFHRLHSDGQALNALGNASLDPWYSVVYRRYSSVECHEVALLPVPIVHIKE